MLTNANLPIYIAGWKMSVLSEWSLRLVLVKNELVVSMQLLDSLIVYSAFFRIEVVA